MNAISAIEINENNLDNIGADAYNINLDSDENTEILSSESYIDNEETLLSDVSNYEETSSPNEEMNNSLGELTETNTEDSDDEENDDLESLAMENEEKSTLNSENENNQDSLSASNSINTVITVQSTNVCVGSEIIVFLKDANGNALANKKLTLTFNNVHVYDRTTDSSGKASLKISSGSPGNYNFTVEFSGDSSYGAAKKSFTITLIKQNATITIQNPKIDLGSEINIFLKDSNGNALANKKLTLTFNNVHVYDRTTDSSGKASLKISSGSPGNYNLIVEFSGDSLYNTVKKSATVTINKLNTTLTILNTTVIRYKCVYAYLKDSSNKPVANQQISITFGKNTYTRTTNSAGKIGMQINAYPNSYETTFNFAGNSKYAATSKSVTIKVLTNVVASSITIVNNTVLRFKCVYAYLKDSSNKPIANQQIKISFGKNTYTRTTNSAGKMGIQMTASPGTYSATFKFAGNANYSSSSKSVSITVLPNGEGGSGNKITQKIIVIDTDIIYNSKKDTKYMNDIASVLRSKGYKVIIGDRDPNAHCTDIDFHSEVCVLCLFGGTDAGMFVGMSSRWYQNKLNTYNNRVVLGFEVPPVIKDLATCTWLPRAHDDGYSPPNFTGLAYPGRYLNEHGMDYVYGNSATELANNFLKYAVNGLSIGMNNHIPVY